MWRYVVGQATGSAHEKLKTSSQDRFFCDSIDAERTLVAAVADGAGSASHAHVAAEIAVATVGSIAQLGVRAGRRDYADVLREAAALARKKIIEESSARGIPLRELACTLLAVIVAPVGGAALQIGDGVIVTDETHGNWRWVFWPQKGEYANATTFLTDESALDKAQISILPNEIQDVALTSDGLESLALHYASRTAHEPFFRTAFAPVHAAQEDGALVKLSTSLSDFLRSASVRSRTDDDTTLVLASRRARGAV